jgi:hypothetical protein
MCPVCHDPFRLNRPPDLDSHDELRQFIAPLLRPLRGTILNDLNELMPPSTAFFIISLYFSKHGRL